MPTPLTIDLKLEVTPAGQGRLTLCASGLPDSLPFSIEPHSRLLISGYGVRVTIVDSD